MKTNTPNPPEGASNDVITDADAAFHAISNMETETCFIRDLSISVVMAGAGSNEVNSNEARAALIRLGWLLVEQVDKLEESRGTVFHQLHPYAHPGKAVQS